MANSRVLLRLLALVAISLLGSAFAFGQQISSLTLNPSSVTAGGTATGTVSLTKGAGKSGLKVTLTSSSADAKVPASVTVASGAQSTTFSISTELITATAKVTIRGTDATGKAESATLTVDVPTVRLTALSFAKTSVTAANPATATVTLSANAPTGGFAVNVASAESYVSTPTSVTVKAGAKTATFTVVTKPVISAGTAAIVCSDSYGYTANAKLTVLVPTVRLKSISVNPTSLAGGSTAIGTVTLSAAAPAGGFVVDLSTMQSYISIPLTVTIPKGSASNTFAISSHTVTSSSSATISGVDGNMYPASATVTVTPQVAGYAVSMTGLMTFSPDSITVPAGSTVIWTNTSGFMIHTSTSDTGVSGLNSGNLSPNQSFSWTVPADAKSGTAYYYHCAIHGTAGNGKTLGGGMAGVVIVK